MKNKISLLVFLCLFLSMVTLTGAQPCTLGQSDPCYITVPNGNVTLNFVGYKNYTNLTNAVYVNATGVKNYSIFNNTANVGIVNNVSNYLFNVSAGESYTVTYSGASNGCDNPINKMQVSYTTSFCNSTYANLNVSISASSFYYMYFRAGSTNFNISLVNLTDTAPYNYVNVFGNTSLPLSTDADAYSLNLSPNTRGLVYGYPSSVFPRLMSIEPGVEKITPSLSGSTYILTSYGIGYAVISNLTSQISTYAVYLNNAYLGKYTSSTFNMTAPNQYGFGDPSNTAIQYTSPMTYVILTAVLILFAVLILSIFAFMPHDTADPAFYIGALIAVIILLITITMISKIMVG